MIAVTRSRRSAVGVERETDEISLHRGVDDLGEVAAGQLRPPFRADFHAEPGDQLSRRRSAVLHRHRPTAVVLGGAAGCWPSVSDG